MLTNNNVHHPPSTAFLEITWFGLKLYSVNVLPSTNNQALKHSNCRHSSNDTDTAMPAITGTNIHFKSSVTRAGTKHFLVQGGNQKELSINYHGADLSFTRSPA